MQNQYNYKVCLTWVGSLLLSVTYNYRIW
jgi:hypothetical protein